MTCGVLGCGALGHGFVTSLLRAGFDVAAYDVSAAALEEASALGATAVPSVAALAARSDALLVALPDTPEILEAFEVVHGHLAPGGLVLVLSTVEPETVVALYERMAPHGIDVLDCPVSGGPERAAAGELTIMVGGPEAAFTRARPVLDALGSSVVHVGPLGHGELTKLANNLMGAVIIEGIAEALAFAARAGVDVRRAAEAIGAGSGSSWILREWLPGTLFAGDFRKRFSLDLMCKDMRIVEALAAELGVPVPALEVAHARFRAAVEAGFGSDDFSRAIELGVRSCMSHPPPTV